MGECVGRCEEEREGERKGVLVSESVCVWVCVGDVEVER